VLTGITLAWDTIWCHRLALPCSDVSWQWTDIYVDGSYTGAVEWRHIPHTGQWHHLYLETQDTFTQLLNVFANGSATGEAKYANLNGSLAELTFWRRKLTTDEVRYI